MALQEDYYCFLAKEMLIVASEYSLAIGSSDNLILPEDIIAVLVWDSDTEQFIEPEVVYPLF